MTTPNLSLQTPANDDLIGSWDVPVNANSNALDTALGGAVTLNATGLAGIQPLTLDQYGASSLTIAGAPAGNVTYQLPPGVGRFLFVDDTTTGTGLMSFASASAGGPVTIPKGASASIVIDPVNGARLGDTIATGAGGVDGQVQVNAGGTLTGAPGLTYVPASQGLAVAGPLTVTGPTALHGPVTAPLVVQASATTQNKVLAFQTAAMPIDCSISNVFEVTMQTNWSSPPVLSNATDGQTINLFIHQGPAGNMTAVWPANFRWVSGTPGVLSTLPAATDLLVATLVSGSWYASLLKGFA